MGWRPTRRSARVRAFFFFSWQLVTFSTAVPSERYYMYERHEGPSPQTFVYHGSTVVAEFYVPRSSCCPPRRPRVWWQHTPAAGILHLDVFCVHGKAVQDGSARAAAR